jgi:hypothetical protein
MIPEMPKQHGLGSGVIVTADGYVLTNNHVVDHASDVRVSLQDGTEYSAKVVGTDPKTDLAVLKVNASGLPAIQMTDRKALKSATPYSRSEIRLASARRSLPESLVLPVGVPSARLRGLHPDRRGDQSGQLGGALVDAEGA